MVDQHGVLAILAVSLIHGLSPKFVSQHVQNLAFSSLGHAQTIWTSQPRKTVSTTYFTRRINILHDRSIL